MSQTVLSVVLEVEPASAGRLSGLIQQLKQDEEIPRPGTNELYLRLKEGVPVLHFMSISVFQDAHYDPIFVIDANFDGEPGPFWAQMEATLGSYLRSMLRCCKRPSDNDGPLYDAVTRPGSRYPVAPYFEARTLTPSVFHQGNRGLDRDRIAREGELFLATRKELAQASPTDPNPYRSMTAEQIHKNLRAALLTRFPWLSEPAPRRISAAERGRDLLRLFEFLFVVLFVLALPGLLFLVFLRAFFFGWAGWFMTLQPVPLALILIAPLVFAVVLFRKRRARPGEAAPSRSGGLRLSFKNKLTSFAHPVTALATVALILAVLVLGVSFVATVVTAVIHALISPPINALGETYSAGLLPALQAFGQAFVEALHSFIGGFREAFAFYWGPIVRIVTVGIYTAIFVSLPAIFVWLRWLERRDSSHDAPAVNERMLREMAHREDWIPQNHMGSVVLVKPGILRMALFRAGHLGLGLVLRVLATDGYLGSMRTVHFAHWAFVNNGSRLMFFSNFDHSWDSYLDDFIEKAHGGLTLSWGSGVGFPPARFLVLDGASHGRKFKAWARHSMAVSRFWFSAYKDYTVDQIERHVRIADGLRKTMLTPKEAEAWARDL